MAIVNYFIIIKIIAFVLLWNDYAIQSKEDITLHSMDMEATCLFHLNIPQVKEYREEGDL